MGEVVYLDSRRRSHTPGFAQPEFYFDLRCPISYLTAERVERTLGAVRWIPVPSAGVRGDHPPLPARLVRERAEALARVLRLPLVWPENFWSESPCALRAAAHAAELGVGSRFALAASRLAFCGGFNLDDPETLAEAAAASAIPLGDCLRAAGDPAWDDTLQSTARVLRAGGVRNLPAFKVGERFLEGESALVSAAYLFHGPSRTGHPAAPLA